MLFPSAACKRGRSEWQSTAVTPLSPKEAMDFSGKNKFDHGFHCRDEPTQGTFQRDASCPPRGDTVKRPCRLGSP